MSDSDTQRKQGIGKGKTKLDLAVAVVPILPTILTISAIVLVAVLFHGPIETLLENDVTKIEAFGVSAEFDKNGFRKLVTGANPEGDFETIFRSVATRLRHTHPLIAGAKILWIDDNHPTQNIREREVVRSLGVFIDIAKSNQEANDLVARGKELGVDDYDVVISDNTRNGDATAGQEFFKTLYEANPNSKLILYTATFSVGKESPNYVFGITDRYEELLHLIMDALERRGTAITPVVVETEERL